MAVALTFSDLGMSIWRAAEHPVLGDNDASDGNAREGTMGLIERRNELMDLLAHALSNTPDRMKIKAAAKDWFSELKKWEAAETFSRAYQDNRMTARCMTPTGGSKTLDVNGTKVKLNATVEGIIARLDPNNFINKNKNEQGLHDLSAILLRSGVRLSQQLFDVKNEQIVLFMPLPLEEDLKVFFLLAELAKRNRADALYLEYQDMRAKFSHIKYGSNEDMHSAFLIVNKPDGKTHVRYGMAHNVSGEIPKVLLDQRIENALNYKSKVAIPSGLGENNEVVIAVRQHAGPFPMLGMPQSDGTYELNNTVCVGRLNDDGTVS